MPSAKRQAAVGFLVNDGMLRAGLRAALHSLGDLERLVNRVISVTPTRATSPPSGPPCSPYRPFRNVSTLKIQPTPAR